MKKKYGKTITSLAMAGILATGSAVPAFAESPKFAHDEATWASLRDNVMEYNEIPLLVEEYNPTYLNNQTSYRDTREERNAWEVRDKQYENAYDAYDSAEELRSQAEDLADSGALDDVRIHDDGTERPENGAECGRLLPGQRDGFIGLQKYSGRHHRADPGTVRIVFSGRGNHRNTGKKSGGGSGQL